MLTPLQHNALQGALESAQNKLTGICVRGSGMLTPLQLALQNAGISAELRLASVSEDQEC
jgi:hypothetical protein